MNTKMNLKPALKYQLTDLLKSSVGFFISMLFIAIGVPLMLTLIRDGDMNVNVSGFGSIAAIFLFVIGIVAPRTYVRLDVQMGVSRATSFVAALISTLTAALVVAIVSDMGSTVIRAIYPSDNEFFFADLYQMIYLEGAEMTFGGHLVSIALNTAMGFCAYICGMFFTFLFWRLNKIGTIVAAIGLVLVFNLGINLVAFPKLNWLAKALESFVHAAAKSPLPIILLFVVIAAIAVLINWLLLRRTYIKASIG